MCVFLSKGIFDSRLNSDNGYLLVVVVGVVEMIRQSLMNTKDSVQGNLRVLKSFSSSF